MGGVAGTVAGATLPFTGFSVFWVSIFASGLLLLGLVLTIAVRRKPADSISSA